MTREYRLTVKHITKSFKNEKILEDVNLDFSGGHIYGIIGKNGTGKSVLFKMICGFIHADEGEIEVNGKKIGKDIDFPESMGAIIEAPGFLPYQSGIKNLEYLAGIRKIATHDTIIKTMEMVGLDPFSKKRVGKYSLGMKQRLAIAQAIMENPMIIILDEPTSFLDIKHKLDLLSILRDMAKKKQITVIMSLHEIDLAQKIADKIICVKGDTISHFGKPEDIFEENMIKELYEINNGFFDPLFGSIELPKPDGEAKTFVICGNGTGIPIFRQLQKEHTPFIAGILYTNDVDYRLARLLASKVITEEPFMEISEEAFLKAQKAMESCERIICTAVPVGSCNKRLGELIDAAKKSGKAEFV